MTSRIPGFYKLRPSERLDALSDTGAVAGDVIDGFRNGGLTVAQADLMVENVISTFASLAQEDWVEFDTADVVLGVRLAVVQTELGKSGLEHLPAILRPATKQIVAAVLVVH